MMLLRPSPPRCLTAALGAIALCAPLASAQQSTSKPYGTSTLLMGQRLEQPDAPAFAPRIAADGRRIAFHSAASNFQGDSPGVLDVFYSEHFSPLAHRITKAPSGDPADGDSFDVDISGDGRWLVFTSVAGNLDPTDTNAFADVYLYEVASDTLRRISRPNSGAESDGPSRAPAISFDGRFVAFQSSATNLVSGDSNLADDIFVYQRSTDTVLRVSVNDGGVQGNADSSNPAIDGSGQRVAFESLATNLDPGVDQNGRADVFLRDLQANTTRRRSEANGGGDANGASLLPALSLNGRFLSYSSDASDLLPPGADTNLLRDVFVEDLVAGFRRRASVGPGGLEADGASDSSSTSNDGHVAFISAAQNLVVGDQNGAIDVFVHRLPAGLTLRASVDCDGLEGDDDSTGPDIAADSCDLCFASEATNLIAGRPQEARDTADIFVHRQGGQCVVLCQIPEIADINDSFVIRSTSGPPGGRIALFVTHVNDLPFTQLILVGGYDGNGKFEFASTLPNDPGLLGVVPSFVAFALAPGGGPIARSNTVFLGIQN